MTDFNDNITKSLGPEVSALMSGKFDSPGVEARRLLKESSKLVDLVRKYIVASAKMDKKDPGLVKPIISVGARAQVKTAIVSIEQMLDLWKEENARKPLPKLNLNDPSKKRFAFSEPCLDCRVAVKKSIGKKGKKS
jgi:hypothetical protein